MLNGTVLCVPRSNAIRYAGEYLAGLGIPVTEKCAPDVSHLLLPVPSFSAGDVYLAHYLNRLPEDVIITGGNLDSPLLSGYRTVDFLQDPYYLAANAAITADCAMEYICNHFPGGLPGRTALVIGWGRIGKCLGKLLEQQGAQTAVAARKPADLAMIQALGHRAVPVSDLANCVDRFDMILNTVPNMVLPDLQAKPGSLVMELASKPGISGENIVPARGLPGKMAPKQSGKLIAETFIRLSL